MEFSRFAFAKFIVNEIKHSFRFQRIWIHMEDGKIDTWIFFGQSFLDGCERCVTQSWVWLKSFYFYECSWAVKHFHHLKVLENILQPQFWAFIWTKKMSCCDVPLCAQGESFLVSLSSLTRNMMCLCLIFNEFMTVNRTFFSLTSNRLYEEQNFLTSSTAKFPLKRYQWWWQFSPLFWLFIMILETTQKKLFFSSTPTNFCLWLKFMLIHDIFSRYRVKL